MRIPGASQGPRDMDPAWTYAIRHLTKDDVTKANATLFDRMISGRLVRVDEGEEVGRRRKAP
eukprot:2818972-Pyramimonas_sp.AAC.1